MRKTLFWIHLVAGLAAGLVILVMCFTGGALAFEDELVAWSEHDARVVTPPAKDATRLPLDDLRRAVREAYPEAQVSAITVSADPTQAVSFSLGRDGALYADPYTGAIHQPASTGMRDFMRTMESWHRALAMSGEQRGLGRTITGACNAAFVLLAITGAVLWWPRKWRTKGLKRSLIFVRTSEGKARDWNWHNVFGFWALIPILVMALSGMVMSYRWASNMVYRVAGEQPQTQQGPGGPGASAATPAIERPPGTRPAGYDAYLAAVQAAYPGWEQITLRLTSGRGPRGGSGDGQRRTEGAAPSEERRQRGAGSRAEGGAQASRGAMADAAGDAVGVRARQGGREGNADGGERSATAGDRSRPQPIVASVRLPDRWPRTASTSLTLNPFTTDIIGTDNFADQTPGRRARMWLRFLHTGQALGWPGQLIAGLGCVAGLMLVYSGFALSIRRLARARARAAAARATAAPASSSAA